MSTNTISAAGPATVVGCPLCAAPIPFEAAHDTLDCTACGARIPLAADPIPVRALAEAA